jgi:hypothetical protein
MKLGLLAGAIAVALLMVAGNAVALVEPAEIVANAAQETIDLTWAFAGATAEDVDNKLSAVADAGKLVPDEVYTAGDASLAFASQAQTDAQARADEVAGVAAGNLGEHANAAVTLASLVMENFAVAANDVLGLTRGAADQVAGAPDCAEAHAPEGCLVTLAGSLAEA